MAMAFRFVEPSDTKTHPVGILQRSLSAPQNEDTFLAAVMAAGGNMTRSVSDFSKTSTVPPNNTNSGGPSVSPPTLNEADTSLNEELFFPSVSAAAAVTLSPSVGPSSVENGIFSGYGSWKKDEMPGLGLPESASDNFHDYRSLNQDSTEEYLRASMSGLQIGGGQQQHSRGMFDAQQFQQPMYFTTQEGYGSYPVQYVQPQGYGRYPAEIHQQTTRGSMGSSSLAPVMDQRYPNSFAGYNGSSYIATPQLQDFSQQQVRNYAPRGGNGNQQMKQNHIQQPRRANNNNNMVSGQAGAGSSILSGQQPLWPSQTSTQTTSFQEEFSSGASSQRPKSNILEDLRSAMRSTSGGGAPTPAPQQQRHRPAGNNTNQNFGRANNNNNNNQNVFMNSSSANGANYSLSDVRGHAVELAQDQFGSRWLQQQLSSSTVSNQDKNKLFLELLPVAKDLASDTFGNYCVQILLNPTVGTPEQQRQLCQNAFEGNMLELSRNTYACRCIQSLIKLFQLGDSVIPVVRQDAMLKELEPQILLLVTDPNANHVAQQVIERIRPVERISFILKAFQGNYVKLAKDPYGCRVCQRVLEHASIEYVKPALDELLAEIDDLVSDSMGNYVVQHIITSSGDRYAAERVRLVEAVKGKLLVFATHKFASNVVEKVLEYGDAHTRREIIQTMLDQQAPTANGTTVPLIQVMMSDLFANYVCQRSLAVADRDQLIRLVAVVRGSAHELRRMTYGKHILQACEKAAAAAGIP